MSEQNTFMLKVAGLARATEVMLEKQASYKEATTKTVNNLVKLGSVKEAEKEKLAESISSNPSKALGIIEKLAETNRKQAEQLRTASEAAKADKSEKKAKVNESTLGTPDYRNEVKKSASVSKADELWEKTFK